MEERKYHNHGVELLQTRHRFEKNGDDAATFHCFDRSTEKIRCERFEVLQNQHAVGLTQDVLGLFVVAPTNLSAGYKEIERVFTVLVVHTSTDELFDFSHSFLFVSACKFKPMQKTC